ncbi:hypothetical protein [Paenibacillus sp. TY11]|uniref:hypothetical protein n=1 Tax=Paenibacillus sp. TY11 TaxID=3448633 RepID=UPI0040399350
MKIHTSPSTFNDYFNQIADSNLMNHENDLIQATLQHEHIYHIPEQWGNGVHRTHFLRKGFELSHSKMLFHEQSRLHEGLVRLIWSWR